MNQWCIMHPQLRIVLIVIILALVVAWPLSAYAVILVDGDFSLDLRVNGEDLSELETIVIDPDGELTIDLYIFGVTKEVVLQKVSAVLTFAGQIFTTLSEDLGSFHIAAGEDYRKSITINTREALKLDNMDLVTGIYRARVKLEYNITGQPKTWSESKNVRIPGNPLSTPPGIVTAVLTGGTTVAVLVLARSLIVPGVAAGTVLPGSMSVSSTSVLHDFVLERLEPTTRGRVMANIVKVAKSRIVKEKCPLCDSYLRHGHCYTCKRPAREVRNEYAESVKTMALQGARLLVGGKVTTLDTFCSELGINTRMGTDVLATLKKSKLVKAGGLARKLTGKALMVGVGTGLSTVLWITVGGFTALSTFVLIAILVASVVIPIAVTKGLQMKARRALKKAP
jgi:hypothetical protein